MNGVSKALIFLVMMTAYIIARPRRDRAALAPTVRRASARRSWRRRPPRPPTRRRATKTSCASSAPSTTRPTKPETASDGVCRGLSGRPLARQARRLRLGSCRPAPPRAAAVVDLDEGPPESRPPAGRAGSGARRSSDRAARPGWPEGDVHAAEQLAAPASRARSRPPTPTIPLRADVQNVSCRQGGLPQTMPTRPPMSA